MVSELNFVPISGKANSAGEVALSYSLDLTAGVAVLDVDDSTVSRINTIYCANESALDVSCVIDGTGQILVFPAGTEEYFPVLTPMPSRMTFSAPNAIDKNITVILATSDLPMNLGA